MYKRVTSNTLVQLYNLTNDECEELYPIILSTFGDDLKFNGFTFEFVMDTEIVHVSKSLFVELLASHISPYQSTAYDIRSHMLQNNVILKSVSNQDLTDTLYVKDEEAEFIMKLMSTHGYELVRSENNFYYLHDLVNVDNIRYLPRVSIVNLAYGWVCDLIRQQPTNQDYIQKKQQYHEILERAQENAYNDVAYNILDLYA